MKVFIIPYTFQTFFDYNKRVSGVDEAMLKQINVLRELGHSVEVYVPFGNLHNYIDGVHYFKDSVPEEGIKKYIRIQKNKKEIIKDILVKMSAFSPDVILSNAYYQKKLYNELQKLNKPLIYMSHAVPGFMSDLVTADDLAKFSEVNSIIAVSEYHAERLKAYFLKRRKNWTFKNKIEADSIVFSSYSNKEDVCESDGVVRHVSAAHKEKQTFLIHEICENTDIKTEVYTTLGFMTKDKLSSGDYIRKSLEKYDTPERPIHLDIDHTEIMDKIKLSSCCFVGLASYDTFTITSLEALSRGVPLIVKGYKNTHPAKEMLSPEYQKYVHIYENKKDILNKIKEFLNIDISERKKIAESCFNMTSKKKYGTDLENALNKAIQKYSDNEQSSLLFQ